MRQLATTSVIVDDIDGDIRDARQRSLERSHPARKLSREHMGRLGRTITAVYLDIVNALNSNDDLAYSSTFSPSWTAATQVLTARLFRLSAQVDF